MSSAAPVQPSVNLLADSIFANGLGAHPDGLAPAHGELTSAQDLLPWRQQMSDVMLQAHAAVDQQVGAFLHTSQLAEVEALKTQLALREKQLLATADHTELFAELAPQDFDFADCARRAEPAPSSTASRKPRQHGAPQKLTLLEYTQIREENARLAKITTTRATADLIQTLRRPGAAPNIPGSRRGQIPLAAATSYVAAALQLTHSVVDKRLSAAAAMWPEMHYRRTKLMVPRLAAQLEQGRVPFDSAISAQQKLADIRQAARRAGSDDDTADELVEHTEKEFLRHALRNNPHTFARFATARRDAITHELIGPRQQLTEKQVQHEKGVFYDAPVGDSLHRLTVIVDDAELLQLTALREFSTKLGSAISTLHAQAHDPDQTQEMTADAADPWSPTSDAAGDDVPKNPRLTSEDIDFGIAQLFDGQTKAERWLNMWLDFTSAGLLLHKTYSPNATEEEQQCRDTALHKAAEHSTLLADILGLDDHIDDAVRAQPEPLPPAAPPKDPLTALIPPGYQLLRPNLDMIIEITLRDLIGAPPGSTVGRPRGPSEVSSSEIQKIVQYLQQEERGLSTPVTSPGHISIDLSLARQQACHQRIIPIVLGSTSQPLDVGRAQRSFPHAIRRALHVRDRGCIVPGCPRSAAWCEPHHLLAWAHGGPTSLENAGLLCRHHHGAVHKQQILIHMEPDGLPSCSLPKNLDPTGTRYRNVFWQT